ncbi:unnamed protein product, partial [Mesorhabditis spiculigera]
MLSKLLLVALFATSAYAFPGVFSVHTIGESGTCGNLAGLRNSEDKDVARVAGILVKIACDGDFQLQHYAEIDKCLADEGNDQMKGCSAKGNMTICDEGTERFSCAITNSAKICGTAEEDAGYMARTMQLGLLLLGKNGLPTELKDCFGALMKMFWYIPVLLWLGHCLSRHSLRKETEEKIGICQQYAKIIEGDENAAKVRVVEILQSRACFANGVAVSYYQHVFDCWSALNEQRKAWPRASGTCEEITRDYRFRINRDSERCVRFKCSKSDTVYYYTFAGGSAATLEPGTCENFNDLIETDENADKVRVVEILRKHACEDDEIIIPKYQKLFDCWAELEDKRKPWRRASGTCDEINAAYKSHIQKDAKKCGAGEVDEGFVARITQLMLFTKGIDNRGTPEAVRNCQQQIMAFMDEIGAKMK